MGSALQQLLTLGFGSERQEPVCWRIERLPTSDGAPGPTDPSLSARLAEWRALLAGDLRPSPYRISRA